MVSWIRNVVSNIIYKASNTGAAPDLQKLLSNVQVAKSDDSRSIISIVESAIASGSNAPVRSNIFFANTEYRGFIYNSSAPLTPTTRVLEMTFHRPDLVKHMSFVGTTGSGTGNQLQGVFNLPYFVNCKTIYISGQTSLVQPGTAITSITGMWPPKLDALHVTSGNTPITSIPKLPGTLRWLIIGINDSTFQAGSNVSSVIANCVNLEALLLTNENWADGGAGGNTSTRITGVLVMPAIPSGQIKYFSLANATLTDITYTAGQFNAVKKIYCADNPSLNVTKLWAIFEEAISSPSLEFIIFRQNSRSYTRSFSNSDFAATLTNFIIYGNMITGSISLTSARPLLVEFTIGDGDSAMSVTTTKNNMANIDVSGLINATFIDLSNSQASNITLPTNSVITTLYLGGNKIDTTITPAILAKIKTYTSLISLRFSCGTSATNNIEAGQNSTNGLGVVDLSTLVNLVTVYASACGVTGVFVLPASMGSFIARGNPGMTGISGYGSSLTLIIVADSTNFNHNFTNTPNVTNINVAGTAISSLDLSAKTSSTQYAGIVATNCPSLTSVTFSPTGKTIISSGVTFSFSGSPISVMNNIEQVSYTSYTVNQRLFTANGCALNTDLKFGQNNWLPAQIDIRNNGMSVANLTANVMGIFNNLSKWAGTPGTKSLAYIAGNSTLPGTEQAPSGYVAGVSLGSPANAKEALWVIKNDTTYGSVWSVS